MKDDNLFYFILGCILGALITTVIFTIAIT
jgi:hypothetical protein